MKKETIQKFLDERPAINKSAFCREADISVQYLNMILREDRDMTESVFQKLIPIMEKYGRSV